MKIKALSAPLAVVLVAGLMSGTALAGETVTYTGNGSFVSSTESSMALSNGGTVVVKRNQVVATMTPSDSGFMLGECTGLAHISAGDDFSSNFFCSFQVNDQDGFDLKGSDSPGGSLVEILGGSGKWADATGSGSVKRQAQQGDQGVFTYSFEITTP